jgi:hypothetical protein
MEDYLKAILVIYVVLFIVDKTLFKVVLFAPPYP